MTTPVANDQVAEAATNSLLGANPFLGIDRRALLEALAITGRRLAERPKAAARVFRSTAGELVRVGAGTSELAPAKSDRRFADAAWSEHPVYKRWMQGYVALDKTMHDLVDAAGLAAVNRQRAHFAVTLIDDALAPTNSLLGNPTAIKHAFDTGGASLWRGARNYADDIRTNGGMPSQVDRRPFRVGDNIATTPGAVVYRDELCELLQYRPSTAKVRRRPIVMIPPQINKYYVLDLAPGRSLVEFMVGQGFQFFVISWRNPTAEQREAGLDRYVDSCKAALAAASQITGSADCNVLGVCAGGLTTAALLGHLAAAGDARVNALTLAVTILDWGQPSLIGMFATERTLAAAARRSKKKGYLDGREMARVFSWLRPNDLVWNYWTNNYLMGNDPPAFDVLYWNADTTRLPAALHGDFLGLFGGGGLTQPGGVTVLGTPIDLGRVKCDAYVVAGITDHITPWMACYASTRLLGGDVRFILSSSGHIQALVNPPGNPKASYFAGGPTDGSADEWLAQASEQRGTWWEDWAGWLAERSGDERAAPTKQGSRRHKVLGAAPGRYVHQH